MSDSPIAGIFSIMHEAGKKFNPPSIEYGVVQTSFPDITIRVGDLLVGRSNLKIADYLSDTYVREAQVEGQIKTDNGEFKSCEIKGELVLKSNLTKGDEVALLASSDGNKYCLLCKVV